MLLEYSFLIQFVSSRPPSHFDGRGGKRSKVSPRGVRPLTASLKTECCGPLPPRVFRAAKRKQSKVVDFNISFFFKMEGWVQVLQMMTISLSPPLKIHLSHRRRHAIKRVEASSGGHVQHLATSHKQILPAPKPPLPNPSFPLHGCVSRQLHSASKLPLHRTCTLLPPFLSAMLIGGQDKVIGSYFARRGGKRRTGRSRLDGLGFRR